MSTLPRMRRGVVAVLLLGVVGCAGGGGDAGDTAPSASATAPRIEGVQTHEVASKKHVRGDVLYDPMPPVGGDHNQVWLRCDVYDEPVPDENAVHSMEHGAVWLTYDPALSADDVRLLSRLHGLRPEYVLVSPFPGSPAKVVASAWGLQLRVDTADDPRLAEFVRAYAGGAQGGEPGAPCVRGGKTPEELRGS